KGISLAWLEWRVTPIVGETGKRILANFEESESSDIDKTDKVTCENIPNVETDLAHFHCNACEWNWHDPREVDHATDKQMAELLGK
ncbi:hypothetical protein ABTH23_18925, partial [Acinetobacter baumannii]